MTDSVAREDCRLRASRVNLLYFVSRPLYFQSLCAFRSFSKPQGDTRAQNVRCETESSKVGNVNCRSPGMVRIALYSYTLAIFFHANGQLSNPISGCLYVDDYLDCGIAII